jgi:sulfide:quinone oxidoreductase
MPFNVLIAGAGPAGLEAALALRDRAGDRVDITLLAPDEELTCPLSVADPFSLAVTRRYPLAAIAGDIGAERVVDRLAAVDPGARVARSSAAWRRSP